MSTSKLTLASEFLKILAQNGGNLMGSKGKLTVHGDLTISPETLGPKVESLHIDECIFTGQVSISKLGSTQTKEAGFIAFRDCEFAGGLEVGQCHFKNLTVSGAGTIPSLHLWCCEAERVNLNNLQIQRRLDFSACSLSKELVLSGCAFGELLFTGNNGPSKIASTTIDERYGDDHRLETDRREKLLDCAAIAATQLRYLGVPTHISTALARHLNSPPVAPSARSQNAA
jgi:hypothetical protein